MQKQNYVEVLNTSTREVILTTKEQGFKTETLTEGTVVRTIYFAFVDIAKSRIYMNYDELSSDNEKNQYFTFVRAGETSYDEALKRAVKENFNVEITNVKKETIKYLRANYRENIFNNEAVQFYMIDIERLNLDKDSPLRDKRRFEKIKKTVKFYNSVSREDYIFSHFLDMYISMN